MMQKPVLSKHLKKCEDKRKIKERKKGQKKKTKEK